MNKKTQAMGAFPAHQNGFFRFFHQHLHACLSGCGRLIRAPVRSLMVLSVIAIVLALPLGLWVSLNNVQAVGQRMDMGEQVTLYLKTGASADAISALQERLKQNPDVASLRYVSSAEGLASLTQDARISEALAALKNNPLPAVLIITPAAHAQTAVVLENLKTQLQAEPLVASTVMDMQWINRLLAVLALLGRFVSVLAVLFGVGVLLVIGSTLYFSMQHYHSDTVRLNAAGVARKLICRPFLYLGALYGALGALLAWALVSAMMVMLSSRVAQLANLYGSDFQLLRLGVGRAVTLVLLSSLLGLWVARFAVKQQLKAITK